MITYNPAFDLYHCIYRMANILARFNDDDYLEMDKVRIWDFYLLFPYKIHDIKIYRYESESTKYRKMYIAKTLNPYLYRGENRKLFERLKAYQMTAFSNLISYGILDKDSFLEQKIHLASKVKLQDLLSHVEGLDGLESNALSFMSFFSKNMPMSGAKGLKARTNLIESKYDTE